jgi:hypothetical protein
LKENRADHDACANAARRAPGGPPKAEPGADAGPAAPRSGGALDGSAASAQYYRLRRRVFYAALKYAARERRLSANPLDGAKDREWRAPEVDHAVDRRRVANPAQMQALLEAIRAIGLSQGPRLVARYGCMYYEMLRPSEAVSLLLPGRTRHSPSDVEVVT